MYKLLHPRNALEWTYVEQDTTYETDVEDTRNTPDNRDTPSNEEIINIDVEQSEYSNCDFILLSNNFIFSIARLEI